MINYITSEYPQHCGRLGPDGTRAFVERCVEAAMRLGMETEGGIGGLIELRLLYGEDLEHAPERVWARNILAHTRLPDHIRIETVRNRLSELTGGLVLVPHPIAA
jgi:hypothetical protein